jgi:hypothetical protein
MSLVTHTVRRYFQEVHGSLNQLDLITFHVEFLSRTAVGTASVAIQPLKLGRQFSTVRVQLLQNDDAGKTTVCFEAHITQGNLSNEAKSGGLSLPSNPMLVKDMIPKREECEAWETDPRLPSRRPASFKTYTYLPPGSDSICASPKYGPSVREQWVRWLPEVGTTFSLSSLAYLADAFRPLPEAYGVFGHWFPTLSYGMEVKRGPPPGTDGWEWLFLRIEIGECIAGRYDMVVLIADEEGNVVAVSRHTALIISAERNYKGRLTKI